MSDVGAVKRCDRTPGCVADLDLAALGTELVRVVAASVVSGNASPVDMARAYYHPQSPEQEFVWGALFGTRDGLAARWFHGEGVRASRVVNAINGW